jgi:hypothetical protein
VCYILENPTRFSDFLFFLVMTLPEILIVGRDDPPASFPPRLFNQQCIESMSSQQKKILTPKLTDQILVIFVYRHRLHAKDKTFGALAILKMPCNSSMFSALIMLGLVLLQGGVCNFSRLETMAFD